MGVYARVITKDHIATEGAKPGTNQNAAGMNGPRGAPDELLTRLAGGEGRPFRMHDDDGELYYVGRIIALDGEGTEDDFAPLDDFGRPNAGCVRIEYKDAHGKWAVL